MLKVNHHTLKFILVIVYEYHRIDLKISKYADEDMTIIFQKCQFCFYNK